MRSLVPSILTRRFARLAEPGPAALGWALLVAVALLVPGSAAPSSRAWLRALEQAGADKAVHFLLFGVLAALLGRWRSSGGFGAPLLVAVLAATVYGALTEALQAVVPGRSPEWIDLVADGVGALAGVVFLRWLRRRSPEPFC